MNRSTIITLLIVMIIVGSCEALNIWSVVDTTNENQKRSSATAEAVEAIRIISDGGTNSGTALTNGKLIYSASGSLVETPYIQSSDGKSLTMGYSGVNTVVPPTPGKLNLVGVQSSTAFGPHLNVYTSGDNYPVYQQLAYTHNNEAISFDMYWDGISWKSSSTSNSFQIYKQYEQLQFVYGSVTSPGVTPSRATSFYIDTAGKTTFLSPVMLSGGNVYLDYYTNQVYNCSIGIDTTIYPASYTVPWILVKVTRIGKLVTYTIPQFRGNMTIVSNYYFTLAGSCFPSALLPDSDRWFPIVTKDSQTGLGIIEWSNTNSWYRFFPWSGYYLATVDVGTVGQSSFSFIKFS